MATAATAITVGDLVEHLAFGLPEGIEIGIDAGDDLPVVVRTGGYGEIIMTRGDAERLTRVHHERAFLAVVIDADHGL